MGQEAEQRRLGGALALEDDSRNVGKNTTGGRLADMIRNSDEGEENKEGKNHEEEGNDLGNCSHASSPYRFQILNLRATKNLQFDVHRTIFQISKTQRGHTMKKLAMRWQNMFAGMGEGGTSETVNKEIRKPPGECQRGGNKGRESFSKSECLYDG